MDSILDRLKEYFKNTPREQVLKDWAKVKEATKNMNSPTIHEFRSISHEEIVNSRSNVY